MSHSTQSVRAQVLSMGFFAAFWWAIVGGFDIALLFGDVESSGDMPIVLFLTPFHCVGIGIVYSIVMLLRRPDLFWVPSHVAKFVRVGTRDDLVLTANRMPPFAVLLGVFGFASFLGLFLVAALGAAGVPSIPAQAIVLSASAFGAYRARKAVVTKQAAPDRFLHVDRNGRTWAFPADAEHRPLGDIVALDATYEATNMSVNDVPIETVEFRVLERGSDEPRPLFRVQCTRADADGLEAFLTSEIALDEEVEVRAVG